MNRSSIKLSLLIAAALAVVPATFGQGWPVPAKAPNTPVACPASSNACVGKEGKLTAPYSDPIKNFVGRYLDSQSTREWQAGFRTARARLVGVNPERSRIYMIAGSALFGYDTSSFIKRLNNSEPLVPATIFGAAFRGSFPETFLMPEAMFYAEHAPQCSSPHVPEGCWLNDATDGQDRLFGFDWDDRGYVYVAYNPYGWGILLDEGTGFKSIWQGMADAPGIVTPNRVLSVKTNGSYYLIVSPDSGSVSNVYYVGDASGWAHEKRPDIRHIIAGFAKATNGHIALAEADGHVHIYTNDGIITGTDVLDITAPSGGSYYSIDTDGTNFFAASKATGQSAQLTILTYNGGNNYTKTTLDLGHAYDDSPRVHWGVGGFILVYGTESYAPGTDSAAARNLRIYRLTGTSLTPVPLMVGDPVTAKRISDILLAEYGVYVQPINYPTVPRGKERLRITPSPYHDDKLIDALAEALVDVWQRLELPFGNRAMAAE